MHVEVEGSGPPVALLHGFAQRGDCWWGIAGPLSERHLVIRPDLRGHGRTGLGSGPATIEGCVEDLLGLAGGHGPRLSLVGYSMGGRVALHAALADPGAFDRLVLIGVGPGLTGAEAATRRRRDESLAESIEREGIDGFVREWEANPLFASQPGPLVARLRKVRLANEPGALAAAVRGMGQASVANVAGRLPGLGLPVLLVTGADDRRYMAWAKLMEERLPRAMRLEVRGAGHAPHLERPEAVVPALLDFLSGRGALR